MFFFNDTATTEIYTLSLHDALPIYNLLTNSVAGTLPGVWEYPPLSLLEEAPGRKAERGDIKGIANIIEKTLKSFNVDRSEEHTSELQSRQYLVCRLLLEKKKSIH